MKQAENVLAEVLVDGWYAGNICWFGTFQYGDRRLSRGRLVVDNEDGTQTVVTTGLDWQAGTAASATRTCRTVTWWTPVGSRSAGTPPVHAASMPQQSGVR